MRNIKRMLALLLTVCMVLSVMPAVFAADPTPVYAGEDEVVVFYTNDIHTYIDKDLSYDNLAALKQATDEQASATLLVDAGDFTQGTAFGSMDKGNTIMALMNAAGYDLATLGNHEFDYDMDGMFANEEIAQFPYISSNFVHVLSNPFEDVAEGRYYTEPVKLMHLHGLINGISETEFAPDDALTRGQFVTILWRWDGSPDITKWDEFKDYKNPFEDVAEGRYYTQAVAWANATGVSNGVSKTTFEPDTVLSREMMITMLIRYSFGGEIPEISEEETKEFDEEVMSKFVDFKDTSKYAQIAIRFGIAWGLINGTSETTLSPKANCTRGQSAKILALNFGLNANVFMPYFTYLFEGDPDDPKDDITVAFLGITTPESFTKSTPAYFQDEEGNYIYDIIGGEDGKPLYENVQKYLDELQWCDYVIGLAHLGDDPASKPWTSEEVIANTVGLDALIDGHSHSTVPMATVKDAEGNDVILTQTGEYFGAIGRMSITKDGIKTGLVELVTVYETDAEGKETNVIKEQYYTLDGVRTEWAVESDETVADLKTDWITEINEQLGEVIGYAEVTFNNYDAESNRLVRKQETNTGDFCADALYYLFDSQDKPVDVAIMNGGGVRNKAITGEISYLTCKEIHTFGNVACLQTITGQQLLDALEWGARDVGNAECGGFLHVSGITYEIHTYIESGCTKDDKGVWTGHEGEYRVKNVKILQDGKYVDLDLKAQYNLAGYNYTLRDLGDGFAMFDDAINVEDYVMEDYMVLANYVQSFEKGENGLPTIGADSIYKDVNGNGRIKIVTEAP